MSTALTTTTLKRLAPGRKIYVASEVGALPITRRTAKKLAQSRKGLVIQTRKDKLFVRPE